MDRVEDMRQQVQSEVNVRLHLHPRNTHVNNIKIPRVPRHDSHSIHTRGCDGDVHDPHVVADAVRVHLGFRIESASVLPQLLAQHTDEDEVEGEHH